MIINKSKRIANVGEYYFSTKLKEVRDLQKQGKPIINLGIGSPDLAPPKAVITALQTAVSDETKHAYQSYNGLPKLREAIAAFYRKNYEVRLDSVNEILPLMGSKEGIMHISMAFLNAGDAVLVPNPGYITYAATAKLLGVKAIYYDLNEQNNFLPDFDVLETLDLTKVKIMWVNYPHMPTGARATKTVFEKLISFAKKHQILLVNDNPYSFILNDEKPQSILNIAGAKEVALELNSLSKTFNMAGWRIGMLLGKSSYIASVLQVKSNMDSGMFYGVQQGAIAALASAQSWYDNQNETYKNRREIVWKILDKLNCTYTKNQVGLFVWSKVPKDKTASALSDYLLYEKAVFVTPGHIFGTNGNRYIRISLCVSETKLNEVLKRVSR